MKYLNINGESPLSMTRSMINGWQQNNMFLAQKTQQEERLLVKRQREFFNSGRTKSHEFRRHQLTILHDVIQKNRDNIATAIYKDLRRPYELSALTEVDGTLEEIQHALKNLKQWMEPEQKREEIYGTPFIYKDPLGVVLVIGPFNFPVTLSLRPAISAIAAGNTVVIKPSEQAVNCSHLLYELISRNFDEEFLTIVEGGIPETTVLLEERFDHIFYTGSVRVGRIVMSAAAINLTPCTLELGGKCPAVVTNECNLKRSVDVMLSGKFLNTGQVCTTPDYIICMPEIKNDFLRMARKWLQDSFGDHPKTIPAYSRMINATQCHRLMHLIEKTNGKIIYESKDPCDVFDHFVGPYLIEIEADDILMEDEVFGPIIPVLTINSLNDAIRFINKHEKPLSAYIFSEDQKETEKFFDEVLAGNCVSNDVFVHYYSYQLPFGGVGHSGMGRYHGKFGFDTFTHEKSVIKASFRS